LKPVNAARVFTTFRKNSVHNLKKEEKATEPVPLISGSKASDNFQSEVVDFETDRERCSNSDA
jgi:hypothetical protein